MQLHNKQAMQAIQKMQPVPTMQGQVHLNGLRVTKWA